MSDLISRKQISNYIKAQINPYGKPFEGTTYEFGLKIMEYIDNMNSAYDVEQVVKELEDYSMWKKLMIYDLTHREREIIARAIEIVKGGGVR